LHHLLPRTKERDEMTIAEMIITPVKVENKLIDLGKEIDSVHEQLSKAEMDYHKAKSAFELSIAEARIVTGRSYVKMRVQDVADTALLQCSRQYENLQISEALVKAARANAQRVRTQVDIVRSIGTSVRASMDN